MWRQLFRWGTIIGLFLAGSAEVVYTEKCLAKPGKRGIFKTHEKVGFKQVLERYDGVLGFSKTNIHFEEREFDRKLENGHAELVFRKSAA
jgi:hypothetical protein